MVSAKVAFPIKVSRVEEFEQFSNGRSSDYVSGFKALLWEIYPLCLTAQFWVKCIVSV